jgi:hypothetical protein
MLKPDVREAIEQLKREFGDETVRYDDDPEGGAYVTVEPLTVAGTAYNNPVWLAFQIPYTYPYADIYPLYTRNDLHADGKPRDGITEYGTYRGRMAMQISRRTQRYERNVEVDTAAAKVRKVLAWMENVA